MKENQNALVHKTYFILLLHYIIIHNYFIVLDYLLTLLYYTWRTGSLYNLGFYNISWRPCERGKHTNLGRGHGQCWSPSRSKKLIVQNNKIGGTGLYISLLYLAWNNRKYLEILLNFEDVLSVLSWKKLNAKVTYKQCARGIAKL